MFGCVALNHIHRCLKVVDLTNGEKRKTEPTGPPQQARCDSVQEEADPDSKEKNELVNQ